MRARHNSSWHTCLICKEEFWAMIAKICKPCMDKIREKGVGQAGYEKWIKDGHAPAELK